MRPNGGLVVILAAGLVMAAGCTTPSVAVTPAETGQSVVAPQVVVALVDTGINPWHEAFRLPATRAKERPPLFVETVPSSFQGDLSNKGLEGWLALEREKLYWFEGTRVLAISKVVRQPEEYRIIEALRPADAYPIYDERNHGTATASVVARISPHAWLLMVETGALDWDAYEWVASQPWIDVISTSKGNLAHLPSNITTGQDTKAAATLQALRNGKLVVAAGGNDPSPNTFDESGPPWVISVGGAEGDQRGVAPLTSQPVDVVANLTWSGLASNAGENETFGGQGTSFGAPAVAGVLAEAIYQLRSKHGHVGGISDGALVKTSGLTVTNHDLRRALNLTATYWSTSDYQPSVDLSLQYNPAYTIGSPALPVVEGTPVGPWVQMGWGFVDAQQTTTIVDLLEGRAAPPDKRGATDYMEQLFAARSALWDVRQG